MGEAVKNLRFLTDEGQYNVINFVHQCENVLH